MSLKAKIEAVIYASEEPVTLVQLVGLLAHEGQAELDELAARQASLALDESAAEPAGLESGDQDALNAELLDTDLLDAPDDAEAAPEAETQPETAAEVVAAAAPAESETEAVAAEAPAPEAAVEPEASAEPEVSAEVAPEEDKKVQRAREKALREYFRSLLDELIADYANGDRGLEVKEIAGGFRFATKPEYHDAVRGFVKSLKPVLKLSLQALETLAVVAYKQPITAPEITEIRGVDSGGVLGGLLARKLIQTAGRKQVIGRPMLYKTSKEFLVRFGLKDINELPSIEEFEKMAGELADNEPVQEEIPMDHAAPESNEPSTALNEQDSVPEPTTTLHETPEEVLGDKSVAPEGHETEPEATEEEAAAVEPSADVHEPQGDGDSTPTEEEKAEESEAEAS